MTFFEHPVMHGSKLKPDSLEQMQQGHKTNSKDICMYVCMYVQHIYVTFLLHFHMRGVSIGHLTLR